jgi:hypothetical protein
VAPDVTRRFDVAVGTEVVTAVSLVDLLAVLRGGNPPE